MANILFSVLQITVEWTPMQRMHICRDDKEVTESLGISICLQGGFIGNVDLPYLFLRESVCFQTRVHKEHEPALPPPKIEPGSNNKLPE